MGRVSEALPAYLAAIDDRPRAPTAPQALFDAARLQEENGQTERALALLRRLIEEYPDFRRRDAALYQSAWLLKDAGQEQQADQAFLRLTKEFPASEYWSDAVYRRAEWAARQERHQEASELLERLGDRPGSTVLQMHTLYLQGQLAAGTGRWGEVMEPMQRLLDRFPDSELGPAARYWIAEALFRTGKYDQADSWYDKIQGTYEEDQRHWNAMIPLRQAQIRMQQEQWDEAYQLATEIETRFPGFRQQYEADYVLGRCLAARGDFEEARRRYERVIRSPAGGRTETAAMAQWMIGESYFHEKRYDDALRAYYRVDSLYSWPRWQAAALLQAGKCHQIKNEPERAARLFAQVQGKYPETDFAQEAAERLGRLNRLSDTQRR
jgi:TolA-binding protein